MICVTMDADWREYTCRDHNGKKGEGAYKQQAIAAIFFILLGNHHRGCLSDLLFTVYRQEALSRLCNMSSTLR